jgi:hypothetical protein
VAFPATPLSNRCEHTPGTCLACVSEYVRGKIRAEQSALVRCPECTGTMDFENIQQFTDAETRRRYDEQCLRRVIEEDKDFVWACVLSALSWPETLR